MNMWTSRRVTLIATLFASGAAMGTVNAQVASPDGRNVVDVITRDGGLFYTLKRDGKDLLLPSRLGFVFKDAPSLRDSLRILGTSKGTFDETWTQPWG
jgi:hypothetical protein